MRTLGALSLLAVPTALLGCLPLSAPGAGTETVEPTRFDWPAEGRCRVTVSSQVSWGAMKSSYDLVIRAAPDHGLRLHVENFEILELDGVAATEPEVRPNVALLRPAAGAFPDFVVSSRGELVEVVGYEEAVDALLVELTGEASGEAERQILAGFAQALKGPMAEAKRRQSRGMWDTWVESWIGWELAPGSREESEGETRVAGDTIPVLFVRTHEGAAEDAPGHVRLRMETSIERDAALEEALRKRLAIDREMGADGFTFEQRWLFRVVTDPRTLRPLRATTETYTLRVSDGEVREEDPERESYTFDWSIEEPSAPPAGS